MAAAGELREWARLRALMMEENRAWLVTVAAERWLYDGYTLLSVTGSVAVDGLADGRYKLTAGKGPQPTGPEELVPPDVAGLLAVIETTSTRWLPCEPTLWSVAESGAKAMLVYAVGADHIDPDDDCAAGQCGGCTRRYPLMVNEEVWTAYRHAYDRNKHETAAVRWEKDPVKTGQPFRVMLTETYTDTDGSDMETVRLLAYVMPAKMPDGAWGDLPDAWAAAQYLVNEAL